jgi:enamine deaminase RidA (YjgF/YER057c/UK114 family)
MQAEERLSALGFALPELPPIVANYLPYKRVGDLLWISGQGPRGRDGALIKGKVGRDFSLSEAYEHARLVGLDLLAWAKEAIGDLDRVNVVKLLAMINAVPEFEEHGKVIDGCSDLLQAVLGNNGRHARASVGMGSLPTQLTVEIEAIVQILPASETSDAAR